MIWFDSFVAWIKLWSLAAVEDQFGGYTVTDSIDTWRHGLVEISAHNVFECPEIKDPTSLHHG